MSAKENPNDFTLCWCCGNATKPKRCPWANNFTPVKDWEAIPTKIKFKLFGRTIISDSYKVIRCPLFSRDSVNGGQKETIKRKVLRDDEDATELASAILERAVMDWQSLKYGKLAMIVAEGKELKRSDMLEFFFSDWFESLLAPVTEYSPGQIRKFLYITDDMREEAKAD